MKEIFENIIKGYGWGHNPDAGSSVSTVCGAGSTLAYTKNLREKLKPLLVKYNIKSMFDAPCGDYYWMSTVNVQEVVSYIGGDIVEFLIEENKQKYPSVEFIPFDLTKDKIPDVDLLHCRDCLLHLSLSNIDNVFINISKSNLKYVLISNYSSDYDNYRDIQNGRARYSNYMLPPYNFSEPLDSILDVMPPWPNRSMVLWPKSVFDTYVKTKFGSNV